MDINATIVNTNQINSISKQRDKKYNDRVNSLYRYNYFIVRESQDDIAEMMENGNKPLTLMQLKYVDNEYNKNENNDIKQYMIWSQITIKSDQITYLEKKTVDLVDD